MKLGLCGHFWTNRLILCEGCGRDAARSEIATPGGVLWLGRVLAAAGLGIAAAPEDGPDARREYFDVVPVRRADGTVRTLRYAGCAPGAESHAAPPCDALVIWDDGLTPLEGPFAAKQALWASNARLPGRETLAALPRPFSLLLDADLLRRNGALISYQISWERSATDLIWQMHNNPAFHPLLAAETIIIPFAEEGVVVVDNRDGGRRSVLCLADGSVEGAARAAVPGMEQRAWAFTVAAAALWFASGERTAPGAFPAAAAAVLRGISVRDAGADGGVAADAALLAAGYTMNGYDIPASAAEGTREGAETWRIADGFSGATDRLAEQIVRRGMRSVEGMPRLTYGKLTSIDRGEIESYRNIGNLISEYAAGKASRPLSIAVFGSPGSGKSFGITQIAENILPDRVVKMEFNVSQFMGRGELPAALHRVRDAVLSGKLPLVFFDEFDSDFDGRPLGWLKSFLMPMQDGRFREGEAEHPVGRCIFVFAGGTCATFEQFASPMALEADHADRRRFAEVKGPDFISRLRGTLNVLGPNRKDNGDRSFLLRRALLLRSLCEKNLPHCIRNGELMIDDGNLNAMMLVPQYVHGARSMESIIDMSRTAGHDRWTQASLPSRSQLALHVDADAFMRLVLRDALLGSCRERLARQIHENYRSLQGERKRSVSRVSALAWEDLPEEYRESNRAQADDIVNKLGRFGYGFDAGDSFFDTVSAFPEDKLEKMARAEHDRWMEQKQAAGWTYAPGEKDEDGKTTPYLLPWEELSHDVQELDRDAVRNIIPLLAQIGMRVYARE